MMYQKKFFCVVVFLSLIVSCKEEIDTTDPDNKNFISFSCETIPVKTYLDGKKTQWQNGDMISIFDGASNCLFSTEDEGPSASFKGTAVAAEKYYALYPYNESAFLSGSCINTSLPCIQMACKGSFATNTVILAASTTSHSIVFRPQMAFFKVTIPENVSSIEIRAYNNVCLTGDCKIDVENSTVTLTGNPSRQAVLVSENGETLSAGTYYIEVLPTILSAGCKITLTGSGLCAGKHIVKSTPNYCQLKGGTIYDMESIPANWEEIPGKDVAASFTKGVNLSGCFEVGKGSTAENIWLGHINDTHFQFLNSIGVDVVRVPMQLGYFIDNMGFTYHLQDTFFNKLDILLDLSEKYGISVIIDNHLWGFYDKQQYPQLCMTSVWQQIATHCKDRSAKVVYELFNEPDGQYWISNWHSVQGELINAIRAIDKKHTIIVTPAPYFSISDLPINGGYADKNLLYSYHFYFPYEFTHQGVPYEGSVVTNIGGKIHFPYQNGDEQAAEFITDKTSSVYTDVQNYANRGTVKALHEDIEKEFKAAATRGGKLFVGEFGTAWAYGMDENSRCNWLRNAVSYMDANHIVWTTWSYSSDFGIFTHTSPNLNLPNDLNRNVADALGFTGRSSVSQYGLVDQYNEVSFQW